MAASQTNDLSEMFRYVRPAEVDQAPRRRPVVIVGAGPVGLATAVDLAQRGTQVVLIDDDDKLATGSRAICFAKRTLEVFDRLGCGDAVVDKGVSWNTGRVFLRNDELYSFDLLGEPGHHRPAFVNLQQFHVEAFLLERACQLPNLEIRWRNRVTGIAQDEAGVELTVETPDGVYGLQCDYLVAADGARSPIRRALGHESRGQTFRDRFLIADVRMQAEFPAERWFWFDPPFHPGQSVLLHRQPDGVWRIDFQLGWDADPVAEQTPERVIPRIQALLGTDAKFELEWVSIYTFSCLRMQSFRDRRVLFAGDCAHGVSPFGARGANSGVQDADNLGWKLHLVLAGAAPDHLLDTYGSEREFAADENILNSTRSTDFITPKSEISRTFRDATLQLARSHPFARRLVNSGRLSTPSVLASSPLNTPDEGGFDGPMVSGAPCTDAPVQVGGQADWLLRQATAGFTLLYFSDGNALPDDLVRAVADLDTGELPVRTVIVAPASIVTQQPTTTLVVVEDGTASARFDARPGTAYLLRPDQHVCARWRSFDPEKIRRALARATCNA